MTTHVKNSTMRVQRTYLGKNQEDVKDLEVHIFETQPAQVNITLGQTIPIRPYETVRVSVSITMPCYKEEVEHKVDEVYTLTFEKLQQIVINMTQSLK